MSSPLLPSAFMYGDLPAGGMFAPIVVAGRNPSNTIDKSQPAGYFWLSSLDQYTLNAQNQRVYGSGNLYYQAGNSSGVPNWVLASSSTGPVESVVGTINQITVTTAAGVATLSIPVSFIAPGAIAAVTTITAGTGLGANSGNLTLSGASSKILVSAATPATASVGTTGALTAGAITVATTAITANSLVFFATHTLGTVTVPQAYRVSARVAGTSFTIQSQSATDTSTVDYWIIN